MKSLPAPKPSAFAYAMQPLWQPNTNVVELEEFSELNVKLTSLLALAKLMALGSTAIIAKASS